MVSVRLGAFGVRSQARLDGFKSRALRAEAPPQRHLYTTEWSHVEVASCAIVQVLAISDDEAMECERLPSAVTQETLATKLRSGEWAALVATVATQRRALARLPLFVLEVALALVQTQVAAMPRTHGVDADVGLCRSCGLMGPLTICEIGGVAAARVHAINCGEGALIGRCTH